MRLSVYVHVPKPPHIGVAYTTALLIPSESVVGSLWLSLVLHETGGASCTSAN